MFFVDPIISLSFRPWKLETLTLLTVKENLFVNLLRTIISSLVNKKCYFYIVILFLCYVFASKDFVFPFLRWILLDFELECIFKKTSKIIQSVLCRMNKRDLFLSTNVLFFDALTILIHHSVLFFSILSQKEKFSVKRKKEFSVKLHDFFFSHFMSDGHIF